MCALGQKVYNISHCITGSFESLHLWIVNVSLFLISRHIIERKWSLCVYEHSFDLQLLTSFEFVIHTEGNIIMQITCCVCVDKEKKFTYIFQIEKLVRMITKWMHANSLSSECLFVRSSWRIFSNARLSFESCWLRCVASICWFIYMIC